MTCKFVVRLLDDAGTLLGWTTLHLSPQPFDPEHPRTRCDFCPDSPTSIRVLAAGRATRMVVHWTDVNVVRQEAILTPLDLFREHIGQVLMYHWAQPVWAVQGQPDVPLPPVTVGESISLVVPTGNLIPTPSGA